MLSIELENRHFQFSDSWIYKTGLSSFYTVQYERTNVYKYSLFITKTSKHLHFII